MFGKFFEGLSVLLVIIISSGLATLLQGRIIFNHVIFLYTFYLKGLIASSSSRAAGQNQTGVAFVPGWGEGAWITYGVSTPQPGLELIQHFPLLFKLQKLLTKGKIPIFLSSVTVMHLPVFYSVACWHRKGTLGGSHCISPLRSLFSNPFDLRLLFLLLLHVS